MPLERGYVQIYTGNGKGKTTAAMGLCLRALGAKMRIFFAQFAKGMHYSELNLLKTFYPQLVLKQYGRGHFIHGRPTEEDVTFAEQGWREIKGSISGERVDSGDSGGSWAVADFDILILDEIAIANYYKLIAVEEVLALIEDKRKHYPRLELVLTGRYVDDRLIAVADLVTEMREVKHYYQQQVVARVGIEK